MRKESELRLKMKATAIAPANIALIKYWGKKDDQLRLPLNPSVSMNLSACLTTTTVEFATGHRHDQVEMIGEEISEKEIARVKDHLNWIRKLGKSRLSAKVVTKNSFPKSSGIASSASGFAALTVAATAALGLRLPERKLSIMARIGSGSACRSIPDGFVEWKEGNTTGSSFAYSLYPPDWWDICDLLLIVSPGGKKVSSTAGMAEAWTSPFFEARLENIKDRIKKVKKALKQKNFILLGETTEEEAVNLHAVMMTQKPPLFYWNEGTMEIILAVCEWRNQGLPVYFTIDAGPNVHLITEGKNEKEVRGRIRSLKNVKDAIVNKPAKGAVLAENHLF